jgi:hypothetical protein
MNELFLRFTVIYEGKWTHSIQDPRMLELKKAEWYETLKEFDAEIIAETINDVKKIPLEQDRDDYPSVRKFYAIAASKAKSRKARREMEARERQQAEGRILQAPIGDPKAAERAREEIRRLCRLKSINPTD